MRKAVAKATLFLAVNLGVIIVTFLLIEGFSSTALVLYEIVKLRPVAERFHTQYDAEIGWVSVPNVFIKDLYGKGKYVRTNSQGFRNDSDIDPKIAEGKIRIVCSGDSFTFGYGVDNESTWCQMLSAVDGSIEAVNLGQGGYGVDQAYLWYTRNSPRMNHHVHLFAFVTDDFRRMESDRFLGYGKPTLGLRDGFLVAGNIPVPRRGFYVPWLTHTLEGLRKLSSLRVLQGVYARLFDASDAGSETESQTAAVALKIFDELEQINRAKSSTLVLVYLPTQGDYLKNSSDYWRDLIRTYAAERKIVYMDLVDEIKKVPPDQLQRMFIGSEVLDYQGAAGHYTEEGNAYIASTLYTKMQGLPRLRDQFLVRGSDKEKILPGGRLSGS